jgi:Spy/CpxP family protein refolding chaperone
MPSLKRLVAASAVAGCAVALTASAAAADGGPGGDRGHAQGKVDEFSVSPGGGLTKIGSVAVPDGVGGEGIVAP